MPEYFDERNDDSSSARLDKRMRSLNKSTIHIAIEISPYAEFRDAGALAYTWSRIHIDRI